MTICFTDNRTECDDMFKCNNCSKLFNSTSCKSLDDRGQVRKLIFPSKVKSTSAHSPQKRFFQISEWNSIDSLKSLEDNMTIISRSCSRQKLFSNQGVDPDYLAIKLSNQMAADRRRKSLVNQVGTRASESRKNSVDSLSVSVLYFLQVASQLRVFDSTYF